MGRYRKVEIRMWGDEKFMRLSPLKPSGQALWIFLISGPFTGPIPGLFRAGRLAMAEELRWEPKAFDEAFEEAFREGMVKADWKAKLVWLPKGFVHNKPESPNVITSWRSEWELLPECSLKDEAFEALKAACDAAGEAFGKAFAKAFGKASPKATGKAMANQEQEQEQEQEEDGAELLAHSVQADSIGSGVIFRVQGERGPSWEAPQALVEKLAEVYPGTDIKQELAKAALWTETNPHKRKTARGMPSFLSRWIERSVNRGANCANGNGSKPASPIDAERRKQKERERRAYNDQVAAEVRAQFAVTKVAS